MRQQANSQARGLTTKEVLKIINARRPLGRTGLYGILKKKNIRYLEKGRVRPMHWPPETPAIVLDFLGERIVTFSQLKAVKRQAQLEKARAA